MPRKPKLTAQSEDREELTRLIREALGGLGLPAALVAERAGINRTHLYHVLSGKKSLGTEKLVALADVLKVSRERLLEAAGYSVAPDAGIDVTDVTILRKLETGGSLKVVTDPRFLDSAIFFWIFSIQPFRPIGIHCDLIKTDWGDNVPQEVSRHDDAIGFYNRRALLKRRAQPLYKVSYWTDLCLYKAYALVARPGQLREPVSLRQANRYLRKLMSNKNAKPIIVSIYGDPLWRLLNNPLTPELTADSCTIERIGNPDLALTRFLDGFGDLFVGGLPQRLAAREKGCIEVLNFRNNPLLFSLNSLICSEEILANAKPVLSASSSLWFHTVSKMKADPEFRKRAAKSILRLLEDHDISDHNLSDEVFDEVFSAGDEFELFPDQPTGLLDGLLEVFSAILSSVGNGTINKGILDDVLYSMRESFELELEKEKYPALV